jgi:hypothetical protein
MKAIYDGEGYEAVGEIPNRIKHVEMYHEGSFWHRMVGLETLAANAKEVYREWELVREEIEPDHFELTFERDDPIKLIEIGEPLEWLKEHSEHSLKFNPELNHGDIS